MTTPLLLKRLVLAAPCLLGMGLAIMAADAPSPIAGLKQAFVKPPADARMMARWWWFGPAVTKPELAREIRAMKQGGFGGFEVQPVYPLVLDDPEHGLVNLPYLSDGFLDALRFVAETGRAEGMRFDLTLCSGWPYGGPHIPIQQASGLLRVARAEVRAGADKVDVPRMTEGEALVAAFLAKGSGREFSPEGLRRLDIAAGPVALPAGVEPPSVVLFFIAGHTRQQVKRAAVGAEGFVLDHYSRVALDTHLTHVGDTLMKAVGPNKPYAVFSDSLEVYGANWTPDLLSEFQKRRGYDLAPYLPALAGNMGEKTAAIRHDWGLTLTELAEDNYLKPLTAWAHKNGTLFRSQTYGVPPVRLSSYALVDLPEGESAQWRRFSAIRWASSASHLYGRPVTSSETFTWLHSPVFRAAPIDMKAEADIHFLNGINQFIVHGWPYSPPQAGEPGWRFYAAAVFNDHNPWWLVMPDINLYMQRMSFLLRQGKPANDVALYLPTDDAWAGFSLMGGQGGQGPSINQSMDRLLGPDVIAQILDAGYNLDFIDDLAIAKSGVPHKILIIPGVERMPLATLQKLDEWVRKGGIAIATRRAPSLAPGLQESETDTPKIRELARAMFEGANSKRLVTDESKLGEALHSVLPPDVAGLDPAIGVVHRKLDFADIYFLANTANHPVSSQAVFRIQGLEGAWWDPMTGKVSKAEGGTHIALSLAPYESRVLVFSKDRVPPASAPAAAAPAPVDISSGWSLTFAGSPAINLDALKSWTELDGRRFFSGQGTYQRTVTVPPGMLSSGHPIYLTLGEGTPVTPSGGRGGSGMRAMFEGPVKEAAVVSVNGKRAGAVWSAPYEVDVTGLLHAGENQVTIVVANLALNEFAKNPPGDYRVEYKDLIAKYGDRFQPQDMRAVQPIESGLLGPIRLVAR
jgi:hypothetical protein